MRLLICGIPGTGKSCFANWLAQEHGFIHHDLDEHRSHATVDWGSGKDLVIDWGFPVSQLETVKTLITAHDMDHWWFDGNRDAARESFLARMAANQHSATEVDWNRQLAGIDAHWDTIASVFAGRILSVISPGPTYVSNEQRFALIQRPA